MFYDSFVVALRPLEHHPIPIPHQLDDGIPGVQPDVVHRVIFRSVFDLCVGLEVRSDINVRKGETGLVFLRLRFR